MQIRRSSYPDTDTLPPCAFQHEDLPCLHRHGFYSRFAGPKGGQLIKIFRFLCKFTGKTVSVLPDHLFPYRSVHVACVEEDFDLRSEPSCPTSNSEQCELVQSCLRRAWHRFAGQSRRQSLTEFFGQRMPLTNTAEDLWKAIRDTAGKLTEILLELASQSKSLFGDYRCLSIN
jgi:hypothetical protein